jgi:hypothetical protein
MRHLDRTELGTNGHGVPGNGHLTAQALDDLYVALFDDVYRKLMEQHEDQQVVNGALDDLFLALRTRRLSSTDREWHDFCQVCRAHRLASLLHQDPFTFRAFSKPRGYAGDAQMMDFIYGREEDWPPPQAAPLGQRIFNYTTLAPAAEGVRARRGFVADLIDQVSHDRCKPHVLSIASGHLREASLCAAVRRGRLGRFLALDADVGSLAEVDRCYRRHGIETLAANFRMLVSGRLDVGRFDLVYSTGLFDYLEQSVARRLVSSMFQLLNPVANFLPGIRDVGYMEAYMDWHLVYRTRREMIEITMDIPQDSLASITLSAEENQNIIFLQVTKKL